MKDINCIYETCKNKLNKLSIKTGEVKYVKVNKRAKRRWGQCKAIKNCNRVVYGIEIAERLLQDDVNDKVTETVMLHELLHTCNNCMNHGHEWKTLANKVNMSYGYNIKRCSSSEEYGITDDNYCGTAKYKITCEKCGGYTYRQRKSNIIKNPQRFRCGCGGKLIVKVL